MKQRQVTLVGGPMHGQRITTTTNHRVELLGDGSSERRLVIHAYDVTNSGHAIYVGVRTDDLADALGFVVGVGAGPPG